MEDEGLITTRVPRALEMKSKLFGYELPDLLLIFFNLAITNLIFGGTSFRYPLGVGNNAFFGVVPLLREERSSRQLHSAFRRISHPSCLLRSRRS
jgi:hypothetical protein